MKAMAYVFLWLDNRRLQRSWHHVWSSFCSISCMLLENIRWFNISVCLSVCLCLSVDLQSEIPEINWRRLTFSANFNMVNDCLCSDGICGYCMMQSAPWQMLLATSSIMYSETLVAGAWIGLGCCLSWSWGTEINKWVYFAIEIW